MATSEGVDVDADAGTVRVRELTIDDPELVEYLETYDQPARTDVVDRAVRVGMHTLRLSKTSKDVEHVKREFADLETRFEEDIGTIEAEIEETFGSDGDVEEILQTHLGEEGKLQRHFDEVFGDDGRFADRLDEELGEDGERLVDRARTRSLSGRGGTRSVRGTVVAGSLDGDGRRRGLDLVDRHLDLVFAWFARVVDGWVLE